MASHVQKAGTLLNMSANWSIFQKAPSQLSFDVHRSVMLPCKEKHHQPAAVCLIHPIISRGVPWRWSISNLGHTAQFLFKCWSFFQQHPSLDRQIVDLIENRMAFTQPWSIAMMHAMDAKFVRGLPRKCAVVWSAPTRFWFPGFGESWFHSTRDACGANGRLPSRHWHPSQQ